MKTFRCLLALAILPLVNAAGQATPPPGATAQIIAPVFHEQVLFSLPGTFQVTAPEQHNSSQYLHEIPLRGESVERWTQLVTLSGTGGLALNPNGTAKNFAAVFVRGYKAGCPASFNAQPLDLSHVSGKPATAFLIGCGTVSDKGGQPGVSHSEAALVLVIQGAADVYTLQWAERGPTQAGPIQFDQARWQQRLGILQPIKICPLAAGTAGCLKQ